MEDEALERLAALGHDEQAARRPLRDECLLDRSPAGDQFLVVAQKVRRRDARSVRVDGSLGWVSPWSIVARPVAARPAGPPGEPAVRPERPRRPLGVLVLRRVGSRLSMILERLDAVGSALVVIAPAIIAGAVVAGAIAARAVVARERARPASADATRACARSRAVRAKPAGSPAVGTSGATWSARAPITVRPRRSRPIPWSAARIIRVRAPVAGRAIAE
ncbi:MAG TPA: hypothetical protein VM427_03600 [Patescibacteria group bacterium]|nr:hypothetical protein [Patescibacteria group bacterium]